MTQEFHNEVIIVHWLIRFVMGFRQKDHRRLVFNFSIISYPPPPFNCVMDLLRHNKRLPAWQKAGMWRHEVRTCWQRQFPSKLLKAVKASWQLIQLWSPQVKGHLRSLEKHFLEFLRLSWSPCVSLYIHLVGGTKMQYKKKEKTLIRDTGIKWNAIKHLLWL